MPLQEALVLLAQGEEARAEADAELNAVLAELGLSTWRETWARHSGFLSMHRRIRINQG